MSFDPISQQAVGQIGQQPVAQFAKQAVSQFPSRRKTKALGTQLHRIKPCIERLEQKQRLNDSAEAGGDWV